MAIIYGLKVNLSVAIVAMVNQTAIKMDQSSHHGAEAHGNVSDSLVCAAPEDDENGGNSAVRIFTC